MLLVILVLFTGSHLRRGDIVVMCKHMYVLYVYNSYVHMIIMYCYLYLMCMLTMSYAVQ